MASIHDLYKNKFNGIEEIQNAAAEMIGKTIVAMEQINPDQLHIQFDDGTDAVLEGLNGKITYKNPHVDKYLDGFDGSEANDYY